MKTAKCLHCGEEFPYNDTRPRKYCSQNCARRERSKPVKITFYKNGEVKYFRSAKVAAEKLCYSLWTIQRWATKYCKSKQTEYISLEEYEKVMKRGGV